MSQFYTTRFYVNVYSCDLAFGGQEEGGWWFDTGQPVESVAFTSREEAVKQMPVIEKKWDDENEGDIGSVNGGTLFRASIEDDFAKPFPETRPHYE